jgi:hypothetical protein
VDVAGSAQVKEALEAIKAVLEGFDTVRDKLKLSGDDVDAASALDRIEESVAAISGILGSEIKVAPKVSRPPSATSASAPPASDGATEATSLGGDGDGASSADAGAGAVAAATNPFASPQPHGGSADDAEVAADAGDDVSGDAADAATAPDEPEAPAEPTEEELAVAKAMQLAEAERLLVSVQADIELHRGVLGLREQMVALKADRDAAAVSRDAANTTLEEFRAAHPEADAEKYARAIEELKEKSEAASERLQAVRLKAAKTAAAVAACEKTLSAHDEQPTDGLSAVSIKSRARKRDLAAAALAKARKEVRKRNHHEWHSVAFSLSLGCTCLL